MYSRKITHSRPHLLNWKIVQKKLKQKKEKVRSQLKGTQYGKQTNKLNTGAEFNFKISKIHTFLLPRRSLILAFSRSGRSGRLIGSARASALKTAFSSPCLSFLPHFGYRILIQRPRFPSPFIP